MTSDSQWKPRLLRHYVILLFLKILNLKDIFFNLAFYDTAPARERGDTPGYCQGETELQFPHLASMDTQEGRVLIMLGNGGNLPPY